VFGQSLSYRISLFLANNRSPVGGAWAMALGAMLAPGRKTF
jgi:hypothetical protein